MDVIDPTKPTEEAAEATPEVASTSPKDRFPKIHISKRTTFILISVPTLFVVAVLAYNFISNSTTPKQTPTEDPDSNGSQQPIVVQPTETPNGMTEYINSQYEFSLMYPNEAKLLQPHEINAEVDTYRVIYTGPTQTNTVTNSEDLEDGYIVDITVFAEVLNTNIDSIALQKRNTYFVKCPDTAEFSNIEESEVASAEARVFTIVNCDQSYKETFLIKGHKIFEVAQVYKGDLGYDQAYENATDQIVSSLKFTNVLQPSPKETWTQIKSNEFGFTFSYPSELDTVCCTIEGPISQTAKKVIVMADPESVLDGEGKRFNGLGIFADQVQSFDEYVEQQKQLLIENYRIIVGKNPLNPTAEEIQLTNARAVLLKNHAWWGDVMLIEHSNPNYVIVISKTELNPGEIDHIFFEVANTIAF